MVISNSAQLTQFFVDFEESVDFDFKNRLRKNNGIDILIFY